MKRIQWLLISLFLFVPFIVKAETLTYDVCESGCEYSSFSEVNTAVNNISDLSDKDIVININSDTSYARLSLGSYTNPIKSLTINGNNHSIRDFSIYIYANNVTLNSIEIAPQGYGQLSATNSNKISINNSHFQDVLLQFKGPNGELDSNEAVLNEILEIDESSNVAMVSLYGNAKIENMNFNNTLIGVMGGTVNIYNSLISKTLNFATTASSNINIYNSNFEGLKYKSFLSQSEYENEVRPYSQSYNSSTLNYDIYDVNISNYSGTSNTMIYFDKEAKLKLSDKLNLVSYLDYYTEDKEIEYAIEDESIAKIENKELIGLKEGSTIVTVTTDEGHVVYRINLTVEKETIPEKIDKMTIKVPITGSKVKAWVLIVGGILLGIIGTCICMLIKRKK